MQEGTEDCILVFYRLSKIIFVGVQSWPLGFRTSRLLSHVLLQGSASVLNRLTDRTLMNFLNCLNARSHLNCLNYPSVLIALDPIDPAAPGPIPLNALKAPILSYPSILSVLNECGQATETTAGILAAIHVKDRSKC